jgi:hypothetical protein
MFWRDAATFPTAVNVDELSGATTVLFSAHPVYLHASAAGAASGPQVGRHAHPGDARALLVPPPS